MNDMIVSGSLGSNWGSSILRQKLSFRIIRACSSSLARSVVSDRGSVTTMCHSSRSKRGIRHIRDLFRGAFRQVAKIRRYLITLNVTFLAVGYPHIRSTTPSLSYTRLLQIVIASIVDDDHLVVKASRADNLNRKICIADGYHEAIANSQGQ